MHELDAWPDMTLVGGELAEELMAVITKLIRSMGRRKAMHVAGCALAAVGLSGLDAVSARGWPKLWILPIGWMPTSWKTWRSRSPGASV